MIRFPLAGLLDEQACYHRLLGILHPQGLCCPRGHCIPPWPTIVSKARFSLGVTKTLMGVLTFLVSVFRSRHCLFQFHLYLSLYLFQAFKLPYPQNYFHWH
jgi:hypothetical protein